MNLGRLSVQQPVLAIVLSIVLTIAGALAYFSLAVSEYPDIAPPTVVIQATYPGASAETVSQTVSTPIELEVNGVEDMLYMYSQATSDGSLNITATFKPGTDVDKAQVLVQNRVALATPRLPEPVQRSGVSVRKSSPTQLGTIFLYSPDQRYDPLYVSNYAIRNVADVLKRIEGVGDINALGAREYSMRIWLDPERVASFGLSPADLIAAVRAQNTQLAGGVVAQAPITNQAFQPNLIFEGRLKRPEDFSDIVVKQGKDGRLVRLKDVARVEIGALAYATDSYMLRHPTIALQVLQQPGANAVATMAAVEKKMAELSRDFPKGIVYNIGYNPTAFIGDSIHELVKTIYEAVVLVVFVVLLFLQGWRPSIIPILSIPVSLVGTFAAMAVLGYSINNLTLFGLVLAVGIVVDNAIVVVENVERHLSAGAGPRDATLLTMKEVGGALFAITLVLCAVFVPTSFIPGISGQFFRQFGVTIAVSTAISFFTSVTLAPALSAMMLKAHAGDHDAPTPTSRMAAPFAPAMRVARRFSNAFNRLFQRLSDAYGRLVRKVVRIIPAMAALYVVLIAATGYLLVSSPKGFIPAQDSGYLVVLVRMPDGATLERTSAIARKIEDIALSVPGVARVPVFSGVNAATGTNSANSAGLFPVFQPWPERKARGLTIDTIAAEMRKRLATITEASIVVAMPPPVQGLGSTGGFAMRLEDRNGLGTAALAKATQDLVAAANRTPGMVGVYTPYSATSPQVHVELDREKAEMLGVPSQAINDAVETYFGSTYINDFNIVGRTYRVTAQADLPFRVDASDLARLKVRNRDGEMVPIGSVTRIDDMLGVDRAPRYNLYPATEINGDTAPGLGSGFAIKTMETLAKQVLPPGISFEWTDLSYQQTTAGNTGLLVFPLCVLLVYLVLAAQYGSWSLPVSILLIVPMCLLAASLGVRALGQDVNILTQIGFIVLVGLAAKNAILIVEVARQLEADGAELVEAVVEACVQRLRPIVMTSLAFILGVLPLVISEGAGAEMRQAVGAAVFFGMIGVTFFGLLFTPVFYVMVRRLAMRKTAVAAVATEAVQ
ncbi:efflux RND transporter permease subunit [Burkholderia cenocepacia]|jgi:hydrophobe/amphiphile efflux-1 (HAE1) family protein|uniref:efflux RND transporter permease subunit n=1 Tax=Burkholderia cenocepacia TaxID=95486 RepID=UPI0004F7E988|nr:multidrug efflux RND transporter permease subunit [Burkholderia cenocepacia]AIO43032.1 RND transporter, hydrophobe/amphiphile efflux-1 family protein [Burkholderia cepacia]KGC04881.1 RND transporter, hydrophobe/amphiphile efflux-1 family protein [Burkholderia cepacia]MCG0580767.1 efflux RND transporter permease subunit [Burkholderia cenocepacia]MCW3524309.1 efflux RND transporter permease subunit [Burkholderia cenocepacia]MCW3614531.1 efflux RND transporter permease subunit [Burkholderia ce